ncbi:hypothetical protein L210DRAFT_3504579 [Boletus edulis BED1]|uniref:Uncharacterized protein n=1 Tax=Boletus edulis BED1 TaxID=1328754 RepID=A0AAD4BT75_BOLED|nr:hypothetical protein L210DRAFT_3504579 [Boletus edulis BED1]
MLKGFPVSPSKRTAVMVQTRSCRKQDAVIITTHKKGGPHVIPTVQSSSETPAPSTSSSAVEEPDVLVTWEEFNWLQEQLQQLNMLHISVGHHILNILRQGEVGQDSMSASAQLRYLFQAANTTSVPSSPSQSAENKLACLSVGMLPSITHPHPHQPGLALGFLPCREVTPPAKELLVLGLQTSINIGDEETDNR